MNKKFFITILCAAAAGAGSAYLISEFTTSEPETRIITQVTETPPKYTRVSEPQQNGSGFPDLTAAAESTVKAVVNIVKKEKVEVAGQGFYSNPFEELFGLMPRQYYDRQPSQEEERSSGGSGVIITPDGYIITNNHVSENASSLKVMLDDGRTFDAKLIGADPMTDIALLKIDATDLPTVPFGDSDKLRLGEWVLAVGNPYGLNSTITAGIVSAKGRDLNLTNNEMRIESFIQTDAAVNPGNSGGALVNTRGELVGINTVIASPTGSYAGYSFAVPTSIVQKVVMDLKEYGIVQRAMLGIRYLALTDAFLNTEEGKATGITEPGGLYIDSVEPGSAAEEAGIKAGDILVEFEGMPMHKTTELQEAMAKHRPNDKVNITVKRKGELKHFEVLLRNKAGEAKLLDKNSIDVKAVLGGTFAPISSKAKRSLRIDNGIQVTEVGNGLLKKSGIREGYIITHINGNPIKEVSDLDRLTDPIQSIDGLYPNGRYVSYSIIND